MTPMDKIISDRLSFDPLAHAERATGTSYKDNDATSMLGLGIAIEHYAVKEKLLTKADDTTFSNDLARYQRIISEEGFRLVSEERFSVRGAEDKFFIYFHEVYGILLAFDTYGGDVNSGKFYYNWRPHRDGGGEISRESSHCRSSGCFTEDMVWIGDHDCREALRFHIRQLRENGTFVTPWVKQPFLWLVHYGESREADLLADWKEKSKFYDGVKQRRLSELPKWVRSKINP